MPLLPTKSKNAATAAGGSNTSAPSLVEDDDEHVHRDVAIFDTHHGREEGLDIDFDEPLLQKIIDACNRRIAETGDCPVITDGHTSDDPGARQPEVLGYASNFRMGQIGRGRPRKAIYATLHIHKNKWDRARQLPRRSIELWLEDLAIDPVVLKRSPIDNVALLGGQRPARDLGLMRAEKHVKFLESGSKYTHEIPQPEEDLNPEEFAKACMEHVSQTPEWKFLAQMMEEHEADDVAKEDLAEEKVAEAEGDVAQAEEEIAQAEDDKVAEDEDDKLEPARLRMQRDQQRRRYAKLESQHKQLYAKVAQLEKRERVAERKADLLGLEQEGINFDMAEELDLVADLEPARYSKHLAHMRKRYQRAPVGVNYIKPAPIPVEGGPAQKAPMTQDEVFAFAEKRARELYARRP